MEFGYVDGVKQAFGRRNINMEVAMEREIDKPEWRSIVNNMF